MRRSGAPSFLKSRTGDSGNNKIGAACTAASTGASGRSTNQILSLLNSGGTTPSAPPQANDDTTKVTCARPLPAQRTFQKLPASPQNFSDSTKQDTLSLSNAEPTSAKLIFEAVYRKVTSKKHKTWEGDGTVEVEGRCAVLKDENGKEMGRATKVKPELVFEEGAQLMIGGKEVELGSMLSKQTSLHRAPTPPPTVVPAKKFKPMPSKPREVQADDFVLPTPNASHQWEFNKSGAEVNRVVVPGFLARSLRPHQLEGVRFLYECVMRMRGPQQGHYQGALLADEMGLGKTLQCIALIWTLLNQKMYGKGSEIQRVLIVTPSSLVDNWERDIYAWLGYRRLTVYKVDAKNSLQDYTKRLSKIAIISYGRLVLQGRDCKIGWDLVICDEAHILKNPATEKSKGVRALPSPRKILLTGSPCQNNLLEFYEILDLANPGCLGTKEDFSMEYVATIVRGHEPSCSDEERTSGEEKMEALQSITSRFMLRRTCELLIPYLPKKQDLVVFCKPAPLQESVYKKAVSYLAARTEAAESLGVQSGISPLSCITSLRYVTSHPGLVKLGSTTGENEIEGGLQRQLQSALSGHNVDISMTEHSGKLQVVSGILQILKQKNDRKSHNPGMLPLRDRVLIVSYSTQTLNMLEALCNKNNYPFLRLDGNTPLTQRMSLVNQFNNKNSNAFVFLLSAKAGGTGLNLTGASRLIMYDLDWNPANDAQALGRIWRGNQSRPVITYRLLTTGTIEEKIFQRQVKKTGINPTSSGGKESVRLCTSELKDLFSYPEDATQENLTHQMLGCMCGSTGDNVGPTKENDPPVFFEDSKDDEQEEILGISQLMRWQHLAPEFDISLMQDLELLYAYSQISFIFRHVLNTVDPQKEHSSSTLHHPLHSKNEFKL